MKKGLFSIEWGKKKKKKMLNKLILISFLFVTNAFGDTFNITDLIICPASKLNDRNNAAISMLKDEIYSRAQIRISTSECNSNKDRPVLYLSVSQVCFFFFSFHFLIF